MQRIRCTHLFDSIVAPFPFRHDWQMEFRTHFFTSGRGNHSIGHLKKTLWIKTNKSQTHSQGINKHNFLMYSYIVFFFNTFKRLFFPIYNVRVTELKFSLNGGPFTNYVMHFLLCFDHRLCFWKHFTKYYSIKFVIVIHILLTTNSPNWPHHAKMDLNKKSGALRNTSK